jgi:hypothetical protein
MYGQLEGAPESLYRKKYNPMYLNTTKKATGLIYLLPDRLCKKEATPSSE